MEAHINIQAHGEKAQSFKEYLNEITDHTASKRFTLVLCVMLFYATLTAVMAFA